jgi:cell division protein FtsN
MRPLKAPRGASALAAASPRRQRGAFVIGVVVGLLIGLILALGVALYITKAPIPFVNKVPQRTAEQDSAETVRNRNWDPNAPLAGKAGARPASAASGVVAGAAAPADAAAQPSARDPASILAGGAPASAARAQAQGTAAAPPAAPAATGFDFYVQAGAFTRNEDAEQQRARLALLGQTARITEREQAGRTVYRVRVGPFGAREEADVLQSKLQEQAIEAQIVRVERP